MSILVIRHGLSQANNRENIGTPAFGHRDAVLMEAGKEQAHTIPTQLSSHYGIFPNGMTVATSTLYRAKELL